MATIDIPGVPTQMAASSKVDVAGRGVVGKGSGNFTAMELPTKSGEVVNRIADSEYKILDNIADQLGNNTSAVGSIKIVTERSACESCLSVVDQFRDRFPKIEVKVFDNNGVVLRPKKKSNGGS